MIEGWRLSVGESYQRCQFHPDPWPLPVERSQLVLVAGDEAPAQHCQRVLPVDRQRHRNAIVENVTADDDVDSSTKS